MNENENNNTQATTQATQEQTPSQAVFFVVGAKWWDKVNGNTYCNSKVYKGDGEFLGFTGFSYGYGSYYCDKARELIEQKGYTDYKLIDLGATYTKKTIVKYNQF